jgi:hypothetical protein
MQSKQGINKDQYYTKKEEANRLSLLIKNFEWFSGIKKVIEPSAGEGSFSDCFSECIAYDIEPRKGNIIEADFIKIDIPYEEGTLSIGNPPFGRNGSLALSFLKKCCQISDYVAFILPLSFTKESIKSKVPLTHTLIHEEILKEEVFYTDKNKTHPVRCLFQIWKRSPREKEIFNEETSDFRFVSFDQTPDYLMKRVGGNAGKISSDLNSSAKSSSYYIKVNIDRDLFDERFRSIKWSEISSLTVGPRSLSKPEVIKAYLNKFPESRSYKNSLF